MELADFSLDLFALPGRVALVTGGNTGLGRAISVALAAAGADVCAVGLEDDAGLTRELVEGHGRRYLEQRRDLTLRDCADHAVAECIEGLGGLDVLVNCAGMNLQARPLEFDRAQWDQMIEVNLSAAFALSRSAARHMLSTGRGKIINIASVYSFRGGQRSPAYSATKHGLVGLTRAYSDELAGHGVNVNAIAPGYMTTELTRATREDPVRNQQVLDHVPAGRWGDPADLMGAVVFLAAPASDFVHGHVLAVDGGYLVR